MTRFRLNLSDYYVEDIRAIYDEDGNLMWAFDPDAPDKLYPERDYGKHDETVSENFFVRMLRIWKNHRKCMGFKK